MVNVALRCLLLCFFWNWFISPVFGATTISIAISLGILLTCSTVQGINFKRLSEALHNASQTDIETQTTNVIGLIFFMLCGVVLKIVI